MKSTSNDPSRWGDASLPIRSAAERLLANARAYDPGVHVTFAEIEEAARTQRRAPSAGLPARLLAAAAAGFVLVTGGVALSRGWLARHDPATPSVKGASSSPVAHVERRRRLRTSLLGPVAVAEGARGADGDVAVHEAPGVATSPQTIDERAAEIPPTMSPPPTGRTAPSARLPAGPGPQAEPSPASSIGARQSPAAPPLARSSAPGLAPAMTEPPPARAVRSLPFASSVMPPAFQPAIPSGSPADLETTQLRDALAQLRGGQNPARALELLDGYDRRFPAGAWREEVAVVRIEALLALGRSRDALERFESLPQAALDRSPRLRVTRGELRARFSRCNEARTDFSAVLDLPVVEEIRARALRGLTVCQTRQPGQQ